MLQTRKIITFLLTFFGYAGIHSLRQGWSYSKTRLHNQLEVDQKYFGLVDTVFLVSYSVGLATIGNLSRRVSLKFFVSIGMILAALCYMSSAIYYQFNGSFSYPMVTIFMCLNGFFQSTGWPGLIGIFRNWFSHGKRGLILGIWAINANIGNIIAELICNLIQYDFRLQWTYNFFFTGIFAIIIALLIMIFIKNQPKSYPQNLMIKDSVIENDGQNKTTQQKQKSINVFQAILIPKVPYYMISYACIKGCIYGLLFWLPTFLAGKNSNLDSQKGYISAMVDVGSFVGGLAVGIIGDKYGFRALYLSPLLFVSAVVMFFIAFVLTSEPWTYYFSLLILGICVGGPYNIIGTVMTIDLGQQVGGKNVSTVSALIQGTAAAFSALSQFVISRLPNDAIFYLFSAQSLLAGLVLMPMFLSDYRQLKKSKLQNNYSLQLNNDQLNSNQ